MRRSLAGWTMHGTDLPGKPDFVFARARVAIFVDGCFWHGCKCKRIPSSNTSFWENKFAVNKRRDSKVSRSLRHSGWIVLRVRECALKNRAATGAFLNRIEALVKGN